MVFHWNVWSSSFDNTLTQVTVTKAGYCEISLIFQPLRGPYHTGGGRWRVRHGPGAGDGARASGRGLGVVRAIRAGGGVWRDGAGRGGDGAGGGGDGAGGGGDGAGGGGDGAGGGGDGTGWGGDGAGGPWWCARSGPGAGVASRSAARAVARARRPRRD
eukprot:g50025.t1